MIYLPLIEQHSVIVVLLGAFFLPRDAPNRTTIFAIVVLLGAFFRGIKTGSLPRAYTLQGTSPIKGLLTYLSASLSG